MNNSRPHTWKIKDIDTFHRLWHDPTITLAEVARQMGVNTWTATTTAARLGYLKRYHIRKSKNKPNGNGSTFKQCRLCEYLSHCKANPHADLFPCEDTRYPTPYVDGRERIEIYPSFDFERVMRLAE